MSEFVTTYVGDNETLADVAMREYGSIDGMFYLQEDNPEVGAMTSDLAPGTVLKIRIDAPLLNQEKLQYVRRGREYLYINKTTEAGAGTCPDLSDLIAASAAQDIVDILRTQGKLGLITALMTNQECEYFLTAEQREMLTEIRPIPSVVTIGATQYAVGDEVWWNTQADLNVRNVQRLMETFQKFRINSKRWGHPYRFTGVAGGYYDSVALAYKDVLGNVVANKAAAFPSNLVMDLKHRLMWMVTPQPAATWATAIANAHAYSITVNSVTYTGWRVPTLKELDSISVNNQNWLYIVEPFAQMYQIDQWINASRSSTSARYQHGEYQVLGLNKTSTKQYVMCRNL